VKELHASAPATVAATPEACTQLLAAVDRYPDWYPEVIREAEVLERAADGTPELVRAAVHVALGPVARDFAFVLRVAVEPGRRVTLSRVPHEAADEERFELAWNVDPGPPTTLRLELAAELEVPRFLPVAAVCGPLAQAFVDAARRALDGSSPNASASSS
jgi:ribosome-associated toxin RatA of RatAB toxin-antitoxin module